MEPIIVKFDWSDSPIWWRNFTREIPPVKSLDHYIDKIDTELRNYNAALFTKVTSDPEIWFETKEDYTFFVLRWSDGPKP